MLLVYSAQYGGLSMYRYVNKYILKYKLSLFVLILLGGITSILSLIKPYILSKFIDMLINSSISVNIYKFIFILFIIFILQIAVSYFNNLIMINIQMKSSFNIAFDVLEHLKKVPLSFINNMDMTYINQRVLTDSNELVSFVVNNLINSIINFFNLIITVIIMIKINLKLSLCLFLVIPIYFITYYLFKKKIYTYTHLVKEAQNIYFSKLNSQMNNIKLIKLNVCFDFFSNKVKTYFEKYFRINFKTSIFNTTFNSIGMFISNISTITLFFVGFLEIKTNHLSVGNFIAINNYFPMLLSNVQYFFDFGSSYQKSLVSYNRIKELMCIPLEFNGERILDSIESIELSGVSASYGKRTIINNFDYKFSKGHIYGILGCNGKGKTTLVNLIIGLNQDYSGNILYNNVKIEDLDLYYIRKNLFGITEQEPNLINDSIRNNITFGNSSLNDETIVKYISSLEISSFILDLPNKLDYEISDKNSNISGGEKQKISLLKAFVKNPNIIILDEPTSALDINSISLLKDYLCKIKNDKIIIVITHDNEFIDVCDEKIYL